jgi:hypothetical protein
MSKTVYGGLLHVSDALEFHAGPKGNNHANTCRIIGDSLSSIAILSALSCFTSAHRWISDCRTVSVAWYVSATSAAMCEATTATSERTSSARVQRLEAAIDKQNDSCCDFFLPTNVRGLSREVVGKLPLWDATKNAQNSHWQNLSLSSQNVPNTVRGGCHQIRRKDNDGHDVQVRPFS